MSGPGCAGAQRTSGQPRRRSTRSTGRFPASWHPSWRSPWPVSGAARTGSPRASTAPVRSTDANYVAPAAFGLARIRAARGDIPGAVAGARPGAVHQPRLHRGPAAAGHPPVRVRRRPAGAGGRPCRSLDGVRLDPAEQAELTAQILEKALDRGDREGPRPRRHIGPYRADTTRSATVWRRTYRHLAGATTDEPSALRAGRPGQRRTKVDPAMSQRGARARDRDMPGPEASTATAGACGAAAARTAGAGVAADAELLRGLRARRWSPTARRRAGVAGGRRRWSRRSRCRRSIRPQPDGDTEDTVAVGRRARLRRGGRRGRLLRDLRHQGAERARPLHRAPASWVAAVLRPRHPPPPQRGRHGDRPPSRHPGHAPCWSSATASPPHWTPTSPAWRRPGRPATCWSHRSPRGSGCRPAGPRRRGQTFGATRSRPCATHAVIAHTARRQRQRGVLHVRRRV